MYSLTWICFDRLSNRPDCSLVGDQESIWQAYFLIKHNLNFDSIVVREVNTGIEIDMSKGIPFQYT